MLFSIITVCFNSAKTIRQTFDSVLQQQYKDYEYIVVDGASTDGTVDIVKEYEPKFEGRMRWLSEPDKGIYDAMNKGIKLSHGEYLNFMNSDDFFEPDALEKTKQVIEDHPGYGVYFGATRWIDANGQELLIIRFHPNNLLKGHGYSLCHQGVFERRDLFPKYNYFSTKYKVLADLHHISTLKKHEETFYPLDFCIARYSMGGVSTQKDNSDEHYDINIALGVELFTPGRKQRERWKKKIHNSIIYIVDHILSIGFHTVCFLRHPIFSIKKH